MWSKLLLRRFRQPGKNPLLPVLQGIAAFRLTLSRMPPRHSQTRRDTNFAIPGYSLSAMIPRRTVKIKFFLSVVIPVVKAVFVPLSAIRGNPANAGVARLCGVFPCPVPDTTTALPNQARYQLRYTRIFSFCHYTTARGEKQSFFSLRSFMCTIHIGQVKKAMRDMVSCDKAELPHQLIRKRDHIPHGQENNTGHGISAIPDEEHGELRLRVRQPVYPDYFTFRAAFSWSTRSVRSQVTPRSSRPMWP